MDSKRSIRQKESQLGQKLFALRRLYNRRRHAQKMAQGRNYVVLSKRTHMSYKNVYGGELQRCSKKTMALTGFTRDGECRNHDDDAGSHHVCIDISSTTGGNFCSVTGQPNWCEEKMPCHENNGEKCPIKNWCVCEWAFASYIEKAGGCDKIADVVCEATNQKALQHYEASDMPHVKRALKCLKEKCNI